MFIFVLGALWVCCVQKGDVGLFCFVFFCHALLVAPVSEVATMFAFIRGWMSTGASRHVVPSMALP